MTATFRWLALRPLARERGRTIFSVLGVALGVAVFVAIRLASGSALASFSDTVDAVAGRANLQVSAAGDGFDERLLERIRRTPGVEAAAPVVQVSAFASARGSRAGGAGGAVQPGGRAGFDETMMVLGLDPLVEAPFVRFETDGRAGIGGAGDALALLAAPNAVAVTRAFATRHGLRAGDTLRVLASGVPAPLRVAAILETPELQQAMGGNVAIVDIATAQDVFARAGRLDRVDLRVAPARRAAVQAVLAASLGRAVVVQPPQARTRQVENMVSAFELNLTALSFIAVFVATTLIFDTMAMAVVRRRRDIGVLRSLGMRRGEIARLWLGEALVLGVLGSALGLLLGTVMARGALDAVGRTLSDLYLVPRADHVRLDAFTLFAGAAIGVLASLGSALLPALEAAATPPGSTLRQGSLIEAQPLPLRRLTAAGAGALLLALASALWTNASGVAMGGFVAAFFVLVGVSLLAPAATLAAERIASPLARRFGGIEDALGARTLREAVARASVVVAALTVAVGMLVALTIMVGSFRRTVDTWITQSLRGDLYVEPVGHRASGAGTSLPDSLVRAARALPGVRAVDSYRATPMQVGGRLAFAVGVDFAVQRDYGRLQFTHGEDPRAVLDRALREGGVIVTESYAHRHGVRAGDTVTLPAPGGPARARVEGVFFDYSTDAGAVLMDRSLFAQLWRDDRTESLALYLVPGTDVDRVRRAFLLACGTQRLVHATPNQELRRRVLAVFDQTFRVTWALQGIAVLVAVLGVVSSLTALVMQRGREIGILRAAGATRGQVRRMVLVESGLLGVTGALLGCVAGVMLALLLTLVIQKQYFGWSIRFTIPPGVFVRAIALMAVTALLAGLAPAQLAATRVAAEGVREE